MSPILRLSDLEQFAAVNLNLDPGHIAGPKIIPSCCMVRMNWTLPSGKIAHNVMYANWTGTPALTATLADTVKAGFVSGATWTAYAATIATTVSLSSVTLLDMRAATSVEVQSASAATPGVAGPPALPDEVALVLTLKTGNRGPSGRGRIYLIGFNSGSLIAGDLVAPGTVTAAQNFGTTNVKATIDAQLGPMSLGLPARAGYTSLKTGRVFQPRAATTVPITQVLCKDNHWDSQRRRGLR